MLSQAALGDSLPADKDHPGLVNPGLPPPPILGPGPLESISPGSYSRGSGLGWVLELDGLGCDGLDCAERRVVRGSHVVEATILAASYTKRTERRVERGSQL